MDNSFKEFFCKRKEEIWTVAGKLRKSEKETFKIRETTVNLYGDGKKYSRERWREKVKRRRLTGIVVWQEAGWDLVHTWRGWPELGARWLAHSNRSED